MRILFAAALMLSLFISASSTIITVSNSTITGGQYTSLPAAITAASAGDTIYVHGSATSYGAITINKKLTLIGAGYAVTGTQNNMNSMTGNITFSGSASSGSRILGINATLLYGASGIINILLSRSYFSGIFIYDNNWVIEHSIIGTNNLIFFYSTIVNCLVKNNFFLGNISTGTGTILANGLIIDHNIFQGKIGVSNTFQYATITNNIFFFAAQSTGLLSNCVFNNNITVSATSDIIPYGSNTGTGNINNVSTGSLFVGGMTGIQTFPSLTTLDWHLKTTSPGHNAGSDTTDIGVYGGSAPIQNFTGATRILPQMTLMNIGNPVIPLNGTLNVRFKARQQN